MHSDLRSRTEWGHQLSFRDPDNIAVELVALQPDVEVQKKLGPSRAVLSAATCRGSFGEPVSGRPAIGDPHYPADVWRDCDQAAAMQQFYRNPRRRIRFKDSP